MNITQWYAIVLGGLAALCIVSYVLWSAFKFLHVYATFYFLKYLFYPQIHRRLRGPSKTTGFDAALIIAFLVANICCISIGVQDIKQLMQRMALMSTINLVPLAIGGQMNIIASHCGLTLNDWNHMHRWLGTVAVVEGLVHSIVAAASEGLNVHISSQVAGLTVSLQASR